MARFVRWAALAAAALLMASCSGGSSGDGADDGKGDPGASASSSSGTASKLPSSLTSQKLDWGRCKATSDGPAPGSDWQCATLKTPLDRNKPDGQTIELALIRSKATGGQDDRIGSLLFNFGGPGGSGVSMMPSYAAVVSDLHERYDLVSWDPRGVAASEGVRCRSDKEIQAAESVDATPDDAAEETAYLKGRGRLRSGL